MARRAALTVFVIFGVTLVTFVISHVVPADPVVAYLGEHAPPALVEKVRAKIEMRRRFDAAAATICTVNLKRFLREKEDRQP